jgi:hypothetical protein
MENTEIKPALTAEEWDGLLTRHHEGDEAGYVRDDEEIQNGLEMELTAAADGQDRHAAAALALYGQPFGFTREDVQLLQDVAYHLDHRQDQQAKLDSLAAHIEALLPPEK